MLSKKTVRDRQNNSENTSDRCDLGGAMGTATLCTNGRKAREEIAADSQTSTRHSLPNTLGIVPPKKFSGFLRPTFFFSFKLEE